MKDKRKVILIAALAVLGAIWIIIKIAAPAKPGPVSAPAPAVARKAPAKDAASRADIKVDLDLLGKPRESYVASKNIFNPVYKKPSLPKAGGKGKGEGDAGSPITVTPLPPLPPPPPPKTQAEIDADNTREEMKKFKILGFLKRKGKVDVFLSLGQENFVAARNDNITKGYYLTDVGKDNVTIVDKKTGIMVKLSTDFARGEATAIPSPGVYGGNGQRPASMQPPQQGMGQGYNPYAGRQAGPAGRTYVQPGNMQRPAADPLGNFSAR